MIQSMEILQLPILALQERIEQEMEENPVLEMLEEEPDLPPKTAEAGERVARRAHRGRARVGDRRGAQQRGRFRAAAEDGRAVARPLRGALATRRANGSKRRASASSTRWPTWSPGRNRCKIICTINWAGSISSPTLRHDGRPDHLQSRHQRLSARPAGRSARSPTPRTDDIGAGPSRRLALVQKLDPPGVAARDLRECLLLQLTPGMPYYEELQDAHLQPSGRPRAQPAADHLRADRLLDRIDPESAGRAAQAESQAGGRFQRTSRAPSVTPDVFVEQDETGKYNVRLEDGHTPEPATSARTIASCLPAATADGKRANTSSGRSIRPNG